MKVLIKDSVNLAKTNTLHSDQLVKDFKHVNRKGHDWRENISQNNKKNMKKMVKESLKLFQFQDGHENEDTMELASDTQKDVSVIQAIEKRCEYVIAQAKKYFKTIEDKEMDPEDLGADEFETYISNSAASNLAYQILNIINKK